MDASVRDTKTLWVRGGGVSASSGASCIDRPMHSAHIGPNVLSALWPVFRPSEWRRFQGFVLGATDWNVLNLGNKTHTRTVYLPSALSRCQFSDVILIWAAFHRISWGSVMEQGSSSLLFAGRGGDDIVIGCSVGWLGGWRMMKWRGFWRKWPWPSPDTMAGFAWRYLGKVRRISG
jgi:hypothetical protein